MHAMDNESAYRCEGCGKTSRIVAHMPGCPVSAAWDSPDEKKTLERIAEACERIADALERMTLGGAPAVDGYTCTKCHRWTVTRTDHAEDCPARNPHPAELAPQPKGYRCPACTHGTYVHREHGCDHEGCDCPAPFGRLMPGDPS
jgi:hypothetical protein